MSPANIEICSNCGRLLLHSEQAYIARGKIVCAECDKALRSAQVPQPTPLPPKTRATSESSRGSTAPSKSKKSPAEDQENAPAPFYPEDAKVSQSCSQPLSAPLEVLLSAKMCTLAIWSFELGILSLLVGVITAIPSLICGIVSLVKINKSKGQLKGAGLAIAGITISLFMVVICIFMLIILATTRLPSRLAR
jgi:uncharacterized membrane protein